MNKDPINHRIRRSYFLETPPLKETKRLAALHGCDIGIPNDAGIGNILMYTRVVDDLARLIGHPLSILTGRLNPPVGIIDGEEHFPLWQNNPFVARIVDADLIDPEIMIQINRERENLCQFNHMIENIAFHYGVRPRFLRPSLYLSYEEQSWAIDKLKGLVRPIICLHPYGTSSPMPDHPWYKDNWEKLLVHLNRRGTVLEIFKAGPEDKQLRTFKIETSLRQMMSLVWASDLFIGFDSSVAHIATAFDVPAAVLWEPVRKVELEEPRQAGFATAALSRWGYQQNRNLMILGDRDDTIINIIVDWVDNILKLLRA
jgi:hypothetical protein